MAIDENSQLTGYVSRMFCMERYLYATAMIQTTRIPHTQTSEMTVAAVDSPVALRTAEKGSIAV